jgi:hypothetical protein
MVEAMIEERVARRDTELRRSPEELAAGFVAFTVGVLFEGLVDDELDAETLHGSIFPLLSTAAGRRDRRERSRAGPATGSAA